MTNSTRIALSPLGLAAAGLAVLGAGALLGGRLALPPPFLGLLLLALALRLGIMATAVGGPRSRAPAADAGPVPGTRRGLLHAAHL